VPSLVPNYSYQPTLEFTMQPDTVIANNPGLTVVQSYGWQANFVPVPEPSSIALIACGLTAIFFHRSNTCLKTKNAYTSRQ
jgi:hypothetical protein